MRGVCTKEKRQRTNIKQNESLSFCNNKIYTKIAETKFFILTSFYFMFCNKSTFNNFFLTKYRKIPLIRPGRMHGQRTNLMDLYSGWRELTYIRGGFIFGRKSTSICNLLDLLLFFLFPDFVITSSYKW